LLGWPRMAENPLVDKISFEHDIPAELEGHFHFGDERALEEIEIQDQVISALGELYPVQVCLSEIDGQPLLLGRSSSLLQGNLGNIDSLYMKAFLSEKEGVPSLAGGDIERPSGLNLPRAGR